MFTGFDLFQTVDVTLNTINGAEAACQTGLKLSLQLLHDSMDFLVLQVAVASKTRKFLTYSQNM